MDKEHCIDNSVTDKYENNYNNNNNLNLKNKFDLGHISIWKLHHQKKYN